MKFQKRRLSHRNGDGRFYTGEEEFMEKDILKQLYQKYRKEIYLYLYSLCKNSSLAEDLLQETFLKALLSLPDDHTNMRAWLYLVARNLFFNYYRREKEKVPLGEVQQIQNTASQEVLEGILKEEKNRLLYQAMNELEERKREILLMQYFGGLSQKEIAAILKMTPENVRVLSYRAKRELRTYMEDHNYDLS